MPRTRQLLGPFILSTTFALIASSGASAAPPGNDTFDGARSITSLPFTDAVDAADATTDAADAAVLSACGVSSSFGSHVRRSVWYVIRPTHDEDVKIDGSENPYRVGIGLVTGSPAGFSRVSCGLVSTSAALQAGTTYYIDASDFDGTGNGSLKLSVRELPPPTVSVTLDGTGTFDPRTGAATVDGTLTCSDAEDVFPFVSLEQPAATPRVTGSGYTIVPCDGSGHRWSAPAFASTGAGRFVGGPAHVSVSASACNNVRCVSDLADRDVLLRAPSAP